MNRLRKIFPLSKEDIILLKRAFSYVKPYRLQFILAFICVVSEIFFSLLQPYLWAKVVTRLVDYNFDLLMKVVVFMIAAYLCQQILLFIHSYLFSYLNEKIVFDIKADMYKKILNMPIKAFDEMRGGELISRINGDAGAIANILTRELLKSVVNVIRVIIIGVIIFLISIRLSLIVLAAFPVITTIYIIFGRKTRKKNREIAKVSDTYFSNIAETLNGIRIIKTLGIKQKKLEEFLNLSDRLKNKSIGMNILNTISNLLSKAVEFASMVSLIVAGAIFINLKVLTFEAFIAFNSYSEQFSDSLLELTELNSSLQRIMISLERIFELIDFSLYGVEDFGSEKVTNVKGEIAFNKVTFGYNPEKPVLKEITFNIGENNLIALVGLSGSGKTTVFNLLLNFYKPDTGTINIDGVNIRELDEQSLRSSITAVLQETFLFNTTIRENLLYANPSATEDEIIKACKQAYIHEYIRELPNGYETLVNEKGINFSAGQLQRISIARALLKKAKIILLDEATSFLDNTSQSLISRAIREISRNCTVVVIAHRLSTIIDSDMIMVLDNGKIAGEGKHKELIKNNAIYKKLYQSELDILKSKEEAQISVS